MLIMSELKALEYFTTEEDCTFVIKQKKYIVGEIAELLGVKPKSINKHIRQGGLNLYTKYYEKYERYEIYRSAILSMCKKGHLKASLEVVEKKEYARIGQKAEGEQEVILCGYIVKKRPDVFIFKKKNGKKLIYRHLIFPESITLKLLNFEKIQRVEKMLKENPEMLAIGNKAKGFFEQAKKYRLFIDEDFLLGPFKKNSLKVYWGDDDETGKAIYEYLEI